MGAFHPDNVMPVQISSPHSDINSVTKVCKLILPVVAVLSLFPLVTPAFAVEAAPDAGAALDAGGAALDVAVAAPAADAAPVSAVLPDAAAAESEAEAAADGGQPIAVDETTRFAIAHNNSRRGAKDESGYGKTQRSGVLSEGGLASTAGLLKWLFSTLAVLGVIVFLAYILKKSRLVQRSVGSLKIESQVALGPKERLVQVQAGSRHLLLGVTAGSINLLTELDPEDTGSSAGRRRDNTAPACEVRDEGIPDAASHSMVIAGSDYEEKADKAAGKKDKHSEFDEVFARVYHHTRQRMDEHAAGEAAAHVKSGAGAAYEAGANAQVADVAADVSAEVKAADSAVQAEAGSAGTLDRKQGAEADKSKARADAGTDQDRSKQG